MDEQLVAEHGGEAGIRNLGLLDSALAAPRHHYTYGERDIFVLAAAYAYGITRNHPFLDGNKRTAFLAAYTFLGINGWELKAPEENVVQMVVGLPDRSISAEAFGEWLRTACRRPRDKPPR
jgi:death-on-curing protein